MAKTFGSCGEITVKGNLFQAETAVINQTITSGQTGELVVIGTAGKITKLTLLTCASSISQAGISVVVDANTVISGTLSDSTPEASAGFYVADGLGTSNITQSAGGLVDVIGEFITIQKDTGNTTEDILYSYITGDTI
jgi:hypothetical protein